MRTGARSGAFALALGLALGAAAGCRTVRPAPEAPAGTAEESFAAMRAARATLAGASGIALVDASNPDGALRFRATLAVRRPNALRVEAMSPFDQPAVVFATEADRYSYYDLERREVTTGPVTPAAMRRMLGVPLRPEDAVLLLLGDVPAPPLSQDTRVLQKPASKGGVVYLLPAGPSALEVETAADGVTPWRATLRAREAGIVWTATFSDWTGEAGTPARLPRTIEIEYPSKLARVRVRWRQVDANPAFSESLFRLDLPPGVNVLRSE